MAHALPHPILYPASQDSPHFLSQYYSQQQTQAAFTHLAHAYPERIKPERRRPKYTRSKNGCLTCRKKKVKCDETKPKCTRCLNSAGECLWPPMSVKKKPQQRRKTSPGDLDGSIDRSSFSSTPSNDHDASNTNINGSTFEANDEINGHQNASPQLSEQNPVKVYSGDVDRRGSTPLLRVPVPLPSRRHSTGDVVNSQVEQQGGSSAGCEGGALGLTQVPQLSSSVRASAEFMYPQSAPHMFHHYPPANAAQVYSNGGSPYGPSRPSTAGSISISHSLARRASSSRPSTAGSLPSSHFVHRPPSSGSGSASGDVYPAGMMFAMNGQHHRQRGSIDMSNTSTPASVASFSSSSRPSTAGSAASSPFMRNVMHLSAEGPNGERWMPPNPSPLMHSVALSQQQQQVYNAEAIYAASMHSTPQHSRPHTPWN